MDETLVEKLNKLCVEYGYPQGLPQYMKYRTSKVIQFASDTFGGVDQTHLELRLLGKTLMLTVAKDHVHVSGFFKVKQITVNAFDLTI